MKNFLRTITGKTLLFFTVILSLCIFLASIFAFTVYTGALGIDFYTNSQQEIENHFIRQNFTGRYRTLGYSYLNEYINGFYGDQDDEIIFQILDVNGTLKSSHNSAGIKDWTFEFHYFVQHDENGELIITSDYYNREESDTEYIVRFLPTENNKLFIQKIVSFLFHFRYSVYLIMAGSGLLFLASFVTLMTVSGRKPDSEELFPSVFEKIPYDLFVLIIFGLCFSCILIAVDILDIIEYLFELIPVLLLLFVAAVIVIFFCMSTAVRIKEKSIFTYTILYKVSSFVFRILKNIVKFFFNSTMNIPLIKRSLFFILLISFLEMLSIMYLWKGGTFILFILYKGVEIPVLIYLIYCLNRLKIGGENLASGKLDYVTKTSFMFGDLKKHGQNLNNIAGGIAIAVEERTKSERMKTELITNVSHDIKTPLTSIINYATLIGNEECDNVKIVEYSEVLVRQSERLKRLIEDLVEASKASTGNLDVNLAPCDANIFLSQASGEYEEKLLGANLNLVLKQPENEVRILADGRRMWRIFDNLMNNICKYAQSGTRVYLTLTETENNAVITFKNTSKEPLDLSEDELMERFVRGDASRNTEGNGLGLSIAKSMAELQGGSLNLTVDGDLFKAVLKFPKIK